MKDDTNYQTKVEKTTAQRQIKSEDEKSKSSLNMDVSEKNPPQPLNGIMKPKNNVSFVGNAKMVS